MDAQQQLVDKLGETIAAPIGALNIALTHLIQQLHNAGIIDKSQLADGIEASSKVQPADLMNAEAIARNLYMLAKQIREAKTDETPVQLQ